MLLDELTDAVLHLRAFEARMIFRALLDDVRPVADILAPTTESPLERSLAAALTEWLAVQRGEAAPTWTASVPTSEERVVLVTVKTQRKLDRLVVETPEPLRRRNFVAPEGFLTMA